jgi:hypothetical protein
VSPTPFPHAQKVQYVPAASEAHGQVDNGHLHSKAAVISPIADAVGPSALRNLPGASYASGYDALSLSALNQLTQLSALGRLAGLADALAGPVRGFGPDMSTWGELVEVGG